MDCKVVEEQIEAYAVGALDQAEASEIAAHLAGCPSCRRQARSYDSAVAALPDALAAASPLRAHPAVKDRIMRRIETTPPGGRRRQWIWPAVAAVAGLALLISTGWGYRTSEQLTHERGVNAELQAKLEARVPSKDQLTVFEIVDSPSTTKLSMRSTDGSGAYGKIFTKADASDVVVMVNRLSQPQPGQTYLLWLTSSGNTRLAGRLDVDSDGFAYLIYRADRKGPTYQSAVVTLQSPNDKTPSSMALLLYQSTAQPPAQ
jgi:hypothetical protein